MSVVGMLVWLIAPLALFLLLSMRTASTSVEPPRPVYVTIEAATDSATRPVALGLRWSASSILVAPGWTGIVQEVLVGSGGEIADGSAIARIDGVVRKAATTPFPFNRALSSDDTGADVSMLNTFLSAHGYHATGGERFGWDTLMGVRAYANDIGVPGSDTVTAFDPSWVVFLPSPGTVHKIDLTIGAPAPSPGDEVVTMKSSLAEAVLLESAPPSNDEADEDEAAPPMEPTALAAEGEQLIAGGETLTLAEDLQRVSPDSLSALAALVTDGTQSIPAVLRTEAVPGQWVIPVPGVIVDRDGATCVRLKAEEGTRPVSVSVIGTADGRVVVSGDLEDADDVAIFPTSVAVSCE